MRELTLGHGDARITELSFGAAGIGNLFTAISEQQAADTVDAAWDGGIRSFDTAPHYGLGLSERRLGRALRDRPRAEYSVSTKVGRLLEAVAEPLGDGGYGDDLAAGFAVPATHRRVWDFSADGVRRSLEASLTRLGLDRVDIVYLHDPDDHAEQALDQAYPELERMRAEGMVRAVGVGMNQSALPARFVRDTDIDAVLLAGRYSLLDQSGLAELLPEAQARGVSVVVGGVFNSGLLAAPKPGATFDYSTVSDELLRRALRLEAVCARHGLPLRAVAARFPLGHPAVAGVLLGLVGPDQVRDALEQFDRTIPAELWQDLVAEQLLDPGLPVPAPLPEGS